MRRMVSSGLAGALGLLLIGATAGSGTTPPTGTASTSLSGVELDVTGAVPADVALLDLTTLATTDPDASGPLAEIALVPVGSGGESIGAVRVSSEDDGEATSAPASLPVGGPLDAGVDAVRLSASASAERASAVVGASAASLSALTDGLGIDLDLTGVESLVTTTEATATQGIGVSGFDLALGDLLPLDVLELLPLDVLLDLAQLLPIGVPDLERIVTDLLDVEERVREVVTELEGAVADLDGALDDLGDLEDAADAVDEASQALLDLGLTQAQVDGIIDDPAAGVEDLLSDSGSLDGIGGGISGDTDGDGTAGDELTDAIGGLTGGGSQDDGGVTDTVDDTLPSLSTGDVSAAALTELETAIVDLAEAVDTQETLESTLGTVEEVTTTVTELVETVTTLVDQLETLLDGVLDLLIDLEGVLPDLLAALADGELLAVGDLDVGMTSVAGATLEASSAAVDCGATSVSIVGQSLGTPDCTSPLTGASGTLEAALSVVSDILGSLPIDVAVVPEVTLSLFPEVTESVTEEDGTITSIAGVTLLALSLPSVTLDAGAVTDGLLSSLLDDLVADLTAQLPTSAELADLDLTGDLQASLDTVLTEVPELGDLTDQVLAAVGELPLGLDLPTLATPGLDMTMASTSTASYTPGSAAPAPDTDSGSPDLPATGGGMAALGLLALLTGTTLRRRR